MISNQYLFISICLIVLNKKLTFQANEQRIGNSFELSIKVK